VSKTGTANAQFTIVTTGMATTVAPGASTTFTVSYRPITTAVGQQLAAIRIASNDSDENPFDIAVSGSALIPEIAVEQPVGTNLVDGTTSIAFGNVPTGSTSVRTFTVKISAMVTSLTWQSPEMAPGARSSSSTQAPSPAS
jgi:hypothetical protein